MKRFIDKANIILKAGDGGNGSVSFRREKFVAAGGPDGGDGGKGADIYMVSDDNLSSLIDFRYKKKFVAENGMPGLGKNKTGRSGETLVIKVPRGTIVRERESNSIIADISGDDPVLIASGGKGGYGNKRFASSTRQIPRFAKSGFPGEKLDVILELKLIADVGLVGFPNVGKSSILSAISAANPKIANYHFTTLSPVLGVVKVDYMDSFVVADVPGLIEGASKGIGLGHEFLRHIDRCRLLLHVVDVSGIEGRDPYEDFLTINSELSHFDDKLAKKPMIVVANKSDIADREKITAFIQKVELLGYACLAVSAATGEGLETVIKTTAAKLKTLPLPQVYTPDYKRPEAEIGRKFDIKEIDNEYYIYAPWLERILEGTDVDNYESLMYFQRAISDSGILAELEKMGVAEEDTVHIGEFQFEYMD
ncbi:MAG: GTPase ObgE [Ruminococcaceae bacterium]|nr:GTPase ObgE [Oscillospiraceae bacterium]